MSPTDIEEAVHEAPAPAGEAVGPPAPEPAGRTRRWWRSPDWWLRTTASAAVGRLVGALLTGVGLALAWLLARAFGAL